MAKINLLPWRQELRKQRKQEFLAINMAVALVALGLILFFHMFVSAQISDQEERKAFIKSEIELLDQWLHLPLHSIRARLKRRGFRRTESAIAVQRYRKCGGFFQATGAYSAHQLAQLLGVSSVQVNGWIKKGWLRATPRGDTVAEHGGPGDRWMITPKAVKDFLFDNAALINPRGINFVWLMDLLRGEK